jgi:protocatechuate 3,4-dioxygenase beta subunit
LILTAMLTAMLGPQMYAQSPQSRSGPFNATTISASNSPSCDPSATGILPNAPNPPTTSAATQPTGAIIGTVLDTAGAQIPDALVTLENTSSKSQRTATTDGTGSFKFDAVEPGNFNVTVSSTGFTTWVSTDLAMNIGQSYALPPIALEIASANTDIEVLVTRHELAEDQMHFEEQQRVLGVYPNFYVSYIKDPPPLSSGQKFRLALRTSADPVTIAIPVFIAGIEQAQNSFRGYGQGAHGFAKRFGAATADSLVSTMITDAILPSVLHQDPRYFYKGTGSVHFRAFYAIASVFICKSDHGHWEPNYSNLLGNLASAGISNIYYPSTDRTGTRLTINNWLLGTASGAVSSLFQEFLVKKISRGIQPAASL